MTTNNLEQIGAEAIRLMTGADRDVKTAQSHIKQVWDAYTAAEEGGTFIVINGASSKTAWAKLINRSTRYCQMIAKDGSRERSEKKDANRVRPMALLKVGSGFKVENPQVFTDERSGTEFEIVGFHKSWKNGLGNWMLEIETKALKPFERKPAKEEEKKPVKHAKNPKQFSTWCRTSITHSNIAQQARHTNCPYCIAAMAAGQTIQNPASLRRDTERQLKEARGRLQYIERVQERHKDGQPDEYWQKVIEERPEAQARIAKLEEELAAIKLIKTPEQALAATIAADAKRKAESEEEDRRWREEAAEQDRKDAAKITALGCDDSHP